MKTVMVMMLMVSLAVTGCATKSGSAGLGALGGAAAGGGVYEYRLHEANQRIEDDYKAGRIDEKEYKARKEEIQRMRVIK